MGPAANGMKGSGARCWYAVHVRSNHEQVAASYLEGHDVDLFLPTYAVRSSRRDRRTTLLRPLFAGYLFVRIDLQAAERIEVLKAPGTVRIVGFGGAPTPVADSTIESLKILVGNAGGEVQPHPLIGEGRAVEVTDGPFRGAHGLLHEEPGRRSRLVVEIEFLGRAVAVPIAATQVRPVFD